MSTSKRGPVELLVKGGKVVNGGRTLPQWIAVDSGKIVGLGLNEDFMPEAKKTIDVAGKYVIPGCVDPEHHPVPPVTESILTETRAAVATGVTTQGMQENTGWMVTLPEGMAALDIRPEAGKVGSLEECFPFFKDVCDKDSMVDWFYTPWILNAPQCHETEVMSKKWGVTSYKLYLHNMTAEHIFDMWPRLKQLGVGYFDDGDIFSLMRDVAKLGPPGIVCIHPENMEISRILKEDFIKQGRSRYDCSLWEEKSPDFVEAGHVHDYSYYARITGCPLYVQHTTTRETIREILKARTDGATVYGQCASHYLTLDKSQWLINTPLRSKEERDVCWEALNTGGIDTIGSDHVGWGRTVEQIEETGLEYKKDIWTAWEGFGSRVEGLLPMLLSEGVNKGRITMERLVELTAENPARIFGIYPKKGAIAVGSDADLVVVDLDKQKKLTRDMVFSRQGWSLWEGWDIKGWPVMTILRGNIMMEWPEGEPRAKVLGEPVGQYMPRYPGRSLYPID